MMGKKIFVSGLNKDIELLSNEDVLFLKKKSKNILYDIYIAKKLLKRETDIEENDSCEIKARFRGYRHSHINEYMKDQLNNIKFDNFDTSAVFVIDEDGALVCPIVLEGNNVEENKEIIRVLRKSSKWWHPAQKNGKIVKSIQGYVFSYEKVLRLTTLSGVYYPFCP